MVKPAIGIVGKGNVGSALATGLRRGGYSVTTVGREPTPLKKLAQDADIFILAIPANQYENALKQLGDVTGKVLVDVANTMTSSQEFAGDLETSHAEAFQKAAKGATVVKAFNTVFAQHMSTGRIEGEPLTVFVASDDEKAKQKVLAMVRDIGFDALDAGPLDHARWLEAMGYWNITLGYKMNLSPQIGFRLVRPAASRATPGREARATATR